MRRSLLILSLASLICLFALPSAAGEEEAAAIRAAVDSGYVQGIHNEGDPEKIRAGLHDGFVMLIRTDDNGIRQVTREAWIERIEAGKASGGQEDRPKATAEITVLDQSGHAAVAKVDLYREGEHLFTDYMSLYKFDDGWKIVGKIFQSHD